MNSLRSKVIRLAFENPILRQHLLPLLKEGSGQYMEVKNLPPSLQKALREVHYGKKDIKVEPAATYMVQGGSGAGQRAFAVAVDLASGQTKVLKGSWGGENAFERRQVDVDRTQYPLPFNGAVIVGVEGGGQPVYAVVYVNPANLQALLPSGADEALPDNEIKALQIIKSMKPGYRGQYFMDNDLGPYTAQNPTLLALVKKGLVKATGAGIQITTAGKSKAESSKKLIW